MPCARLIAASASSATASMPASSSVKRQPHGHASPSALSCAIVGAIPAPHLGQRIGMGKSFKSICMDSPLRHLGALARVVSMPDAGAFFSGRCVAHGKNFASRGTVNASLKP